MFRDIPPTSLPSPKVAVKGTVNDAKKPPSGPPESLLKQADAARDQKVPEHARYALLLRSVR